MMGKLRVGVSGPPPVVIVTASDAKGCVTHRKRGFCREWVEFIGYVVQYTSPHLRGADVLISNAVTNLSVRRGGEMRNIRHSSSDKLDQAIQIDHFISDIVRDQGTTKLPQLKAQIIEILMSEKGFSRTDAIQTWNEYRSVRLGIYRDVRLATIRNTKKHSRLG
jgi:hypothetical protein